MPLETQVIQATQTALENCKVALTVPWYVLPVGAASVALAATSVVPPLVLKQVTENRLGRTIWILLIVGFLYAEWNAIHWDDIKRTSERGHDECESRNQFTNVGNNLNSNFHETGIRINKNIETAQNSFDAASHSLAKATEAVDMLTGGRSFPFVEFDDGMKTATLRKSGRNPLYNLTITFLDASECIGVELGFACKPSPSILGDLTVQEVNIESFYGNDRGLKLDLTTLGDSEAQSLLQRAQLILVDISARNGHWREYFWNGSIATAYGGSQRNAAVRVYRILFSPKGEFLGRNLVWERLDKYFPKEALGFDLLDFGETTPVYWYGRRVHVASIEEGGVKASKLERGQLKRKPAKRK